MITLCSEVTSGASVFALVFSSDGPPVEQDIRHAESRTADMSADIVFLIFIDLTQRSELFVVHRKKMERSLILVYVRESPGSLKEMIVDAVVVDL